MNDEVIEEILREELKKHGERWGKEYKQLNDTSRKELLGRLIARRVISERRDSIAQQKEDPEIYFGSGEVGSTLQHGTGGGKRVIRSTSSFS